MKISIAMATYNGSKFLQEQLASFLKQTRLPDEVIVCDDGSTDETSNILSDFREKAPFKVQVYKNEQNIGFVKNFEKAISLCTGDVIFLSDQDDVWFNKKLERIEKIFFDDPGVWVVINEAEIADEFLNGTGITAAGQVSSVGLSNEKFLLGCCIAFRSCLFPLLFPIPHHIHSHDCWINTLGNILECRKFVPEILQLYRRHSTNTSSWPTTRTTRASRWCLFKEKVRLRNLQTHPLAACDSRLAQLRELKKRLESQREYLTQFLPSSFSIKDVLEKIDRACRGNEVRRDLQTLHFRARLVRAVSFYRAGGYQQFEGILSLVRDIVGGIR